MNRITENRFEWHNNEYIRYSGGKWTIMTNGINCGPVTSGLKILLDKEYKLLIAGEPNGTTD